MARAIRCFSVTTHAIPLPSTRFIDLYHHITSAPTFPQFFGRLRAFSRVSTSVQALTPASTRFSVFPSRHHAVSRVIELFNGFPIVGAHFHRLSRGYQQFRAILRLSSFFNAFFLF